CPVPIRGRGWIGAEGVRGHVDGSHVLVTIGPVVSPVTMNPYVWGLYPARRAVAVKGESVNGLFRCCGIDMSPTPVGPARQSHGAPREKKFEPCNVGPAEAARSHLPKVGHTLPRQAYLENRSAPLFESADGHAAKNARGLTGNSPVDHGRGRRPAIRSSEDEGAGPRISSAPQPNGDRGFMLGGACCVARAFQRGKRLFLAARVTIRTLGRNIKISAGQVRGQA